MADLTVMEGQGRDVKRYVLIGSFLGGLVGATAALLLAPQSPENRLKTITEIQRDLFRPVKNKFREMVEHIGDSLIKAIDDAAATASTSTLYGDEEGPDMNDMDV
ncbi:MAG: YtxH domain-containing protein [Candidatus Magnetominusculus sp. LBB02]|nr:YtxH domain-containing protein [Candidatus Magnetominusculus sp. LBB02]